MRMRKFMGKTIKSTVLLSLMLTALFSVNVFASEKTSFDKEQEAKKNELKQKLEIIEKKYDVKFTFDNLSENVQTIDFANLEEVEQFFKERRELEKAAANEIKDLKNIQVGENTLMSAPSVAAASATTKSVSKYAPFSGPNSGIFYYQNIVFQFTSSVLGPLAPIEDGNVTDSYATGFYGGEWTHRYGNAYITSTHASNDTLGLSATGTWKTTMQILGLPIGATWQETWTNTYINW